MTSSTDPTPGAARTEPAARAARAVRHQAIRAQVAEEEAAAGEAEAAERSAALEVAMHLRIDRALDAELRARAGEQHIPTSALVRRLLRQGLAQAGSAPLSSEQVEDIARRVAREELHR